MAESVSSRASTVTLGVPKETLEDEKRVALIPDVVKRYTAAGVNVVVETGAGASAYYTDEAYAAAGATIVPDAAALYAAAEVILKVRAPQEHELGLLRSGQALFAFLAPLSQTELAADLAQRGVIAISMDAIPRTTRAQSMDALSSMGTVAGYKAALLAADFNPRFFPMLMTAAGTIPPAKVLIIGAGVAGLQAIATARRLGGVVESYDTRPVVKEQVESLGAKFVEVDMTGIQVETQDSGGYAREASPELLRRQQETMARHTIKSDAVISTAAVPGRPAPKLIMADTVRQMAPGSVIVDLAAETGGNCELTVPGEVVVRHGVTIIGMINLPSTMPYHSSQMYAKNLQNLLALFINKEGQFHLNFEDDIVQGVVISNGGEIVHAATKARMQSA